MSRLTERLLQVAAAVLILWYGYSFIATVAVDAFVTKVKLAQCQKTMSEKK